VLPLGCLPLRGREGVTLTFSRKEYFENRKIGFIQIFFPNLKSLEKVDGTYFSNTTVLHPETSYTVSSVGAAIQSEQRAKCSRM
jgi:hypothetical protein